MILYEEWTPAVWAAICATHTAIKTWINRGGEGALVKLQLPTICTLSAPGAPSGVWAWLGLEMVISLSNSHSAGSAFQINTQEITSSAYPDTHSFCSPPLSLSLKKKKNHPFVNNDKAGELFLRKKKKGIYGGSQRRTVETYELLKWKCPWNSEQHSHRHHLHINADRAGKKEEWAGGIMGRGSVPVVFFLNYTMQVISIGGRKSRPAACLIWP